LQIPSLKFYNIDKKQAYIFTMDLISRKYYFERIDKALINVPVTILIGARQVGKTSIMKTLIKSVTSGTINSRR